MTLRIYSLIQAIINAVLAVVAFFLLLRVIFLLISVNQTTPFVAWILNISSMLMTPFWGMVPNIRLQTGVLDMVALISLLAYALVGYLLQTLFFELTKRQIIANEREIAHYHDIEKEEKERHYPHR